MTLGFRSDVHVLPTIFMESALELGTGPRLQSEVVEGR